MDLIFLSGIERLRTNALDSIHAEMKRIGINISQRIEHYKWMYIEKWTKRRKKTYWNEMNRFFPGILFLLFFYMSYFFRICFDFPSSFTPHWRGSNYIRREIEREQIKLMKNWIWNEFFDMGFYYMPRHLIAFSCVNHIEKLKYYVSMQRTATTAAVTVTKAKHQEN